MFLTSFNKIPTQSCGMIFGCKEYTDTEPEIRDQSLYRSLTAESIYLNCFTNLESSPSSTSSLNTTDVYQQ